MPPQSAWEFPPPQDFHLIFSVFLALKGLQLSVFFALFLPMEQKVPVTSTLECQGFSSTSAPFHHIFNIFLALIYLLRRARAVSVEGQEKAKTFKIPSKNGCLIFFYSFFFYFCLVVLHFFAGSCVGFSIHIELFYFLS